MKNTAKKTLALLLALVIVMSLVPAMGIAAYADDTSYTLTIPSTLSVAKSGWNATSGISATGTLASGKKLTVTASSANSWALKSGDNSVGYTLTTAEGGSQTTSWEFTELSGSAATQPMGIIVEDYSTKPAGAYQDTVIFTAKVETAGPQLHSFTLTGPYTGHSLVVEFYEGDKWSDMVEKYSLITATPTVNWVGFSTDGFIYKGDKKILTTDTVDPNATYYVQ